MNYVFDTSFTGALIIPDEKCKEADKIHSNIGEDEDIFIPQLFWYEITNVFRNLVIRKRYSLDEVKTFYSRLAAIRLSLDSETGVDYSKKIMRISIDYNLSSYDAAYLELAERKNSVLCTLDDGLIVAAKKYGVKVIK